jgi:hypothetical protein
MSVSWRRLRVLSLAFLMAGAGVLGELGMKASVVDNISTATGALQRLHLRGCRLGSEAFEALGIGLMACLSMRELWCVAAGCAVVPLPLARAVSAAAVLLVVTPTPRPPLLISGYLSPHARVLSAASVLLVPTPVPRPPVPPLTAWPA